MKTFVLTGGASGIGEGIKKQLISEGNKVISIDLRNADIESDLSTVSYTHLTLPTSDLV